MHSHELLLVVRADICTCSLGVDFPMPLLLLIAMLQRLPCLGFDLVLPMFSVYYSWAIRNSIAWWRSM